MATRISFTYTGDYSYLSPSMNNCIPLHMRTPSIVIAIRISLQWQNCILVIYTLHCIQYIACIAYLTRLLCRQRSALELRNGMCALFVTHRILLHYCVCIRCVVSCINVDLSITHFNAPAAHLQQTSTHHTPHTG